MHSLTSSYKTVAEKISTDLRFYPLACMRISDIFGLTRYMYLGQLFMFVIFVRFIAVMMMVMMTSYECDKRKDNPFNTHELFQFSPPLKKTSVDSSRLSNEFRQYRA